MNTRENVGQRESRQPVGSVFSYFAGVSLPGLLLFGFAFFLAYKYGNFFSFNAPAPLWFPDAVLLCALLLVPRRQWLLYLFLSLPLRLAFEAHSAAPFWFVLTAFANDSCKAALSAYVLQRLTPCPIHLKTLRQLAIFIAIAVISVPALSAVLGGAARVAAGYPFWSSSLQWFMGDATAVLVLTPMLLYWCLKDWRGIKVPVLELVGLIASMAACLYFTFMMPHAQSFPIVLYAPVPFLIWAATRLGPIGISTASSCLALISMTGAVEGTGPFSANYSQHSVLSMQLFLIATSIPMLFVAILIAEREHAERELIDSNARLETTYYELLERWQFETVLFDISQIISNLQARGGEDVLRKCLERVGEFVDADSVTIWTTGRIAHRAHTWTNPASPHRTLISPESLPATMERLSLGEVVRFSSQNELDGAGDGAVFRSLEIRSFLAVPLKAGGRLIGGVAIASRGKEFLWGDELVGRICTIFESVANSLLRAAVEIAEKTEYELNSAMLESLPGIAVLVGPSGEILRTNAARMPVTHEGHHPQFQGLKVGHNYLAWWRELQAQAPSSEEGNDAIARVVLGAGQKATLEWHLPPPTEFWMEVRAIRLHRPEGHTLLVHLDVTARKRAEIERSGALETIAHLNRVSAMGQMAASLAHELGQPLAAIMSNAQAAKHLASRNDPDLPEIRAALTDIAEDDMRARAVVQNMRDILKKGKVVAHEVDLNEIVKAVARLIKNHALLRGVRLNFSLSSDPVLVRGDVVPLQQVILNLVNNGMDSMNSFAADRKTITVRTAADKDKNLGVVLVEDCGPGIAEDIKAKLFSPFFTTKEEGLGIGLSICNSIVESLGGRILIETRAEPGAVFRVELPMTAVP